MFFHFFCFVIFFFVSLLHLLHSSSLKHRHSAHFSIWYSCLHFYKHIIYNACLYLTGSLTDNKSNSLLSINYEKRLLKAYELSILPLIVFFHFWVRMATTCLYHLGVRFTCGEEKCPITARTLFFFTAFKISL